MIGGNFGDEQWLSSGSSFNPITSVIRIDGGSESGNYLSDGDICATMTFRLNDNVSLEDLTEDTFGLVEGTGALGGLQIWYDVDESGITKKKDVSGLDYLVFDGFKENDNAVKEIEVVKGLDDVTYYEKEPIKFEGMKLKITYNDGTWEYVTKDDIGEKIFISEGDELAKTDKTITITAGKAYCYLYYLLPQEISVSKNLSKMTYEHGDNIEWAGGEITITYSDGTTTEKITDIAAAITSGMLTVDRAVADIDNKKVRFTYKDGLFVDLELTVTDPIVGIEISTMPGQTELEYNETSPATALGRTTGKIKPVLKSGKRGTEIAMSNPNVTLTPSVASIANCGTNVTPKSDGTQAGRQTVTVSYTEGGQTWSGYTESSGASHPATYEVLVNDTISEIEVTTQPTSINKYGTTSSGLILTGGVITIKTTSGQNFTRTLEKSMIDFTGSPGYQSNSLAEQSFNVKYGNKTSDAGKGVKLQLTDYIKEIEINSTQDPKTKYNEELTDAHLSTAGVTYTPVYASGAKGAAVPVTEDIVQNYKKDPKTPAYTYDSDKHEFTETVKAQVALLEYTGAQATKVFSKDFTLKVVDTVSGIEVSDSPSQMVWDYGDPSFDDDGMRIKRIYQSGAKDTTSIATKDNSSIAVTNADGSKPITLTPDANEFGPDGMAEKVLKITYTDPNSLTPLSTTTKVIVRDVLKSIAINTDPENKLKDSFYHAEAWGIGQGKLDIEYESGRTTTVGLNSRTSFEFAPSGDAISTEPTNAEYATAGGNTVTKTVKVTYTENNVSKNTTYPITITNYVDTMVMKRHTKKKYVLNASTYDLTTDAGKFNVEVTWLNGKKEQIDLDNNARLSLPALSTLTANEGDDIPVTVTLIDSAGNNVKDKGGNAVTTQFLIDVGDGIVSTNVTGDLSKTAYNVGDAVDLTGLHFYEKYGSTPTTGEGSEGKEITYSSTDSRFSVVDDATGGAFTTDLFESAFVSGNISTRNITITYTPTGREDLKQELHKTVTVYNQVTSVTKHTNPKTDYALNEAMGTVEVLVQRAAKKTDGTPSLPVTKALSVSDFSPVFTTATPGSKTMTYTYIDNDFIGADGTVTPNSLPALTYTYSVADAITKVEMIDGMTEADKKYNHGETPDFSKLEIYTKKASDTDTTTKGQKVTFADALANNQITVKATFRASEGPQDVTSDLSQITKLASDLFGSDHWATVPLTVTFKATLDGGDGINNKAEVPLSIKVYDVIDKIEIQAPLGDDPKKYIIGDEVIYPVGKYKVIRKSGQTDPTEPNITKEMLDALGETINTSSATTTPVTVTITHKENDAHGTEKAYPDTFKYTVADVITRIEIKTPAPKPKVKYGATLQDSDLSRSIHQYI